ncbi:ATP-binding protein [Caballeronia sp. LZ062]|uniref:ATP-binding protein n=1 Tax=unclassified Caballeronia TaxID=2646786 RepID=UPI0028552F47|nr:MULTISPECIES: ATP-binding protein [unclassified Caballeronia]MDR5857351.1 ATP-binding protein [Caballeronia sp. LZ050]MDR5868902.1 ATP-binding protein [Caballeronia sp. LZ062]
MSLAPRSLFARNVLLLVALVAVSQVCALAVLLHFIQTPRIERAAATFASYIETLDTVLRDTPAGTARLDIRADLPASANAEPPRSWLRFYRTYQRDTFVESLRRHLPPDMPVRWQSSETSDDGQQRLWIRVHLPGDARWIALAVPEAAHDDGLTTTLLLSLGLGALAIATAYAIQRHLNRPLSYLADAAQRLSAGGEPGVLPTDGPTEIAQVSSAFNRMTAALAEAEATRALMLAGISHDIRTPMTKLRLAMAMSAVSSVDALFAASAESYLDQIDTILQQFMDYAGSGAKETPVVGDINALVANLAADFSGLGHEFALSLGEIPPFAFRPIGMMRMIVNLMQNAVLYGVVGLGVRTWTDEKARTACIVVEDRGKGFGTQDAETLKQPFKRGGGEGQPKGTGLGLAIVERMARLHGGTLELRARDGGGAQARLVLPLANSAD